MEIIHISNNKVKANVVINDETHRCDFFLDKELKISSLGVEDDEVISPQDIDPGDLANFQKEIDVFIEAQAKLVMRSDYFGCYYRVINTTLEYAAMLSNGDCDTEWGIVEFPASMPELQRINEYFKTNYSREDFDFVHDLE